jgi:hypothetical protein
MEKIIVSYESGGKGDLLETWINVKNNLVKIAWSLHEEYFGHNVFDIESFLELNDQDLILLVKG